MEKEFTIGEKVRLIGLPAYVKTAEPMPMLRPPNVIHLGEIGIVIERRPGDYWGVRFERGAFLIETQYLEAAESISETASQVSPLED
ncbi:MAG: regulatory protein SipA [Actinomycetota bacterium]